MRWILIVLGILLLLGLVVFIMGKINGDKGESDPVDMEDFGSDYKFTPLHFDSANLERACSQLGVRNMDFVRSVMSILGITSYSVHGKYVRAERSGQNVLIYPSGRIADLNDRDKARIERSESRGSWSRMKDNTWRVTP